MRTYMLYYFRYTWMMCYIDASTLLTLFLYLQYFIHIQKLRTADA